MWIFRRSHICCPPEDQKRDDVSLGHLGQAVFTGFTGLGQWTKRGKFEMFQQQKKKQMKLQLVQSALLLQHEPGRLALLNSPHQKMNPLLRLRPDFELPVRNVMFENSAGPA